MNDVLAYETLLGRYFFPDGIEDNNWREWSKLGCDVGPAPYVPGALANDSRTVIYQHPTNAGGDGGMTLTFTVGVVTGHELEAGRYVFVVYVAADRDHSNPTAQIVVGSNQELVTSESVPLDGVGVDKIYNGYKRIAVTFELPEGQNGCAITLRPTGQQAKAVYWDLALPFFRYDGLNEMEKAEVQEMIDALEIAALKTTVDELTKASADADQKHTDDITALQQKNTAQATELADLQKQLEALQTAANTEHDAHKQQLTTIEERLKAMATSDEDFKNTLDKITADEITDDEKVQELTRLINEQQQKMAAAEQWLARQQADDLRLQLQLEDVDKRLTEHNHDERYAAIDHTHDDLAAQITKEISDRAAADKQHDEAIAALQTKDTEHEKATSDLDKKVDGVREDLTMEDQAHRKELEALKQQLAAQAKTDQDFQLLIDQIRDDPSDQNAIRAMEAYIRDLQNRMQKQELATHNLNTEQDVQDKRHSSLETQFLTHTHEFAATEHEHDDLVKQINEAQAAIKKEMEETDADIQRLTQAGDNRQLRIDQMGDQLLQLEGESEVTDQRHDQEIAGLRQQVESMRQADEAFRKQLEGIQEGDASSADTIKMLVDTSRQLDQRVTAAESKITSLEAANKQMSKQLAKMNGDLKAHNHDEQYARLDHNHDEAYAAKGHGHDDLAQAIADEQKAREAGDKQNADALTALDQRVQTVSTDLATTNQKLDALAKTNAEAHDTFDERLDIIKQNVENQAVTDVEFQKRLDSITSGGTASDEVIRELTDMVRKTEQQATMLKSQIAALTQADQQMKEQLAALNGHQHEETKQAIAAQQEEIAQLRTQLTDAQSRLQSLEAAIKKAGEKYPCFDRRLLRKPPIEFNDPMTFSPEDVWLIARQYAFAHRYGQFTGWLWPNGEWDQWTWTVQPTRMERNNPAHQKEYIYIVRGQYREVQLSQRVKMPKGKYRMGFWMLAGERVGQPESDLTHATVRVNGKDAFTGLASQAYDGGDVNEAPWNYIGGFIESDGKEMLVVISVTDNLPSSGSGWLVAWPGLDMVLEDHEDQYALVDKWQAEAGIAPRYDRALSIRRQLEDDPKTLSPKDVEAIAAMAVHTYQGPRAITGHLWENRWDYWHETVNPTYIMATTPNNREDWVAEFKIGSSGSLRLRQLLRLTPGHYRMSFWAQTTDTDEEEALRPMITVKSDGTVIATGHPGLKKATHTHGIHMRWRRITGTFEVIDIDYGFFVEIEVEDGNPKDDFAIYLAAPELMPLDDAPATGAPDPAVNSELAKLRAELEKLKKVVAGYHDGKPDEPDEPDEPQPTGPQQIPGHVAVMEGNDNYTEIVWHHQSNEDHTKGRLEWNTHAQYGRSNAGMQASDVQGIWWTRNPSSTNNDVFVAPAWDVSVGLMKGKKYRMTAYVGIDAKNKDSRRIRTVKGYGRRQQTRFNSSFDSKTMGSSSITKRVDGRDIIFTPVYIDIEAGLRDGWMMPLFGTTLRGNERMYIMPKGYENNDEIDAPIARQAYLWHELPYQIGSRWKITGATLDTRSGHPLQLDHAYSFVIANSPSDAITLTGKLPTKLSWVPLKRRMTYFVIYSDPQEAYNVTGWAKFHERSDLIVGDPFEFEERGHTYYCVPLLFDDQIWGDNNAIDISIKFALEKGTAWLRPGKFWTVQ